MSGLVPGGVTACLLQNEPASQPTLPLKQDNLRRHSESESEEGEDTPSGVLYGSVGWTRNRVIYPWSGRSEGNTLWRAEPLYVEECSDELWVGVKCQSNAEIAGSPRNAFRCSVGCFHLEVEH
jgi:hypothetical protein